MVASYLLPVGGIALAWLGHSRRPWLATIGGPLVLAGDLSWSTVDC